MPRELTEHDLRNQSGEIMRALDRGEGFVVTRNGVAVGELRPLHHRRFVAADAALAAFAGAPPSRCWPLPEGRRRRARPERDAARLSPSPSGVGDASVVVSLPPRAIIETPGG